MRDKILGLETHDVDIALDTCTGTEFANLLKEYVTEFEKEACGKIGVIAANPSQSKHLETATMRLHGIEVDFSNLRHEQYAVDSRIPTTKVGTPVEDSYRRDFTLNALYYNLTTRQVEDWTKRGLHDLLKTRIVSTPLNAFSTFHDDPLRVLRAIRFTVRYQMRLSDDIQTACRNVQIRTELLRKVSRERVGKELEGMLSGKHADPQKALTLICDLGLGGSVFPLPQPDLHYHGSIGMKNMRLETYRHSTDSEQNQIDEAWQEAKQCLSIIPMILAKDFHQSKGQTELDSRIFFLATILLPFQRLEYTEKNKSRFIVESVLREGIKFKNKDVQSMTTVAQNLEDMFQLLQQTPDSSIETRLQVGLLLRKARDLWVTVLCIAAICGTRSHPNSDEWLQKVAEWHAVVVETFRLDKCWQEKPLFNGKELIKELALPTGPEVGMFISEQIRWTLRNPQGSREDCLEYLRGFRERQSEQKDGEHQHIPKKLHR